MGARGLLIASGRWLGARGAALLDAGGAGQFGAVALVAVIYAVMVAGAYNPWARPPPGRELQQVRTTLRARLLIYRWPALSILGILIVGRLAPGAWIPDGLDLLALLLVIGWLLFPVRYSFTDQGCALHSGRFWPWEEFHTYRRAGSTLQLRRMQGRDVSLFLTNPQQQSVLPLLRRHISQRGSERPRL